jgi:hypothetical protein
MTTISGAGAENGWPARIETVVHKAIGVLMMQDQSTVAEASASLDEMVAATGLDVRAVAAEIVRSTRADEAARPPLMTTDPEVDVEVLVDDTWWPGYLFRSDWRKASQGPSVCLVRFTTRTPEGLENRARQFDEVHIRPRTLL